MTKKSLIKRIGKHFIVLKQENEKIIYQSVLVVDNGYCGIGQLNSAIEEIKNYFPKAEISILSFEQRKVLLEKYFPGLHYIFPSQKLKRYQIALAMLKRRKVNHDFVILFSLDISPLLIGLMFFKSKIVLYNQWGQWWSLRLRNTTEIFKTAYIKKKTLPSLKNFLKKIGLFFILLKRKDLGAPTHSILIIDNSYASFEQFGSAIKRLKESLPSAKISVLSFGRRNEFENNFPELDFIYTEDFLIKKYSIAWHMLKLRNMRFDYIVLLSLDVTPIISSLLFINSRVLLYNQWHQWWSLKLRPFRYYLTALPKLILSIMINIAVFLYLLTSVSCIFLKRSFNVFRFNLLGKKA